MRGFLSVCITSYLLSLVKLFEMKAEIKRTLDKMDKWDVLVLTRQREKQLGKTWNSKIIHYFSICSRDLVVIASDFQKRT